MTAKAKLHRRPGRPKGSKDPNSSSTKDEILDAAEIVVVDQGPQNLTLDAVYKMAGISKGGLLYHFPSKELLIDAMLVRYLERSDSRERELSDSLGPKAPGKEVRGMILQLAQEDPQSDHLGAALLAAVATDLERLAPFRRTTQQQFQELKGRKLQFEKAVTIALATHGLMLLELLKLPPLSATDRKQLLVYLDRLAGGDGKLIDG